MASQIHPLSPRPAASMPMSTSTLTLVPATARERATSSFVLICLQLFFERAQASQNFRQTWPTRNVAAPHSNLDGRAARHDRAIGGIAMQCTSRGNHHAIPDREVIGRRGLAAEQAPFTDLG